jgi:hypothetical protein
MQDNTHVMQQHNKNVSVMDVDWQQQHEGPTHHVDHFSNDPTL